MISALVAGGLAVSALAADRPTIASSQFEPGRVGSGGGPVPVGLVVSGGVSLGSYQAGSMYYLTEVARRNPERIDLSLLTGTSAGSINAFITAVASCRPAELHPRDSLFFRTWVPVGFDQLYQPAEATAYSALSRSAFAPAVAALREEWEHGLREGCERTLGFTTTRITPQRTRVGELSDIPHSEERFSLVVKGLGYGREPSVSSFVLPNQALPQPVLPLGDTSDPFGVLLDVVYASSAFPLAFEPVGVAFCTTNSLASVVPRCAQADAETVELVDGALFDNTPLRLAVELAKARDLAPGPFALLPSDALAWPRPSGSMADPGVSGTLGLVQAIGQGFVETAQQTELRVVVEQYPEILDRLTILRGRLPSHGESLFAFAGFFERGFREADFVQGMVAAHFAVEEAERVWGGGASEVTAAPNAPPVGVAMSPRATAGRPGWRSFDCLVAVLEDDDARAQGCRHTEVTPLRPLFQVAIDRLYAECVLLREQGIDPDSIRDPRCRHAMSGGRPPLVPGLDPPADSAWRRQSGEDWFQHQLRRLYAHRFVWVDEGLGVARPNVARRHLRDRLGEPALALARGNVASSNRLIRLIAEFGLNQLSYSVPPQLTYVGVGAQLEGGWSARMGRVGGEWVRLGGVLAVDGLTSPLRSGRSFVGVTPLFEVQVEPVPLSSALVQPRLGLQLGYRLSSADRLGTGECGGEGQICTEPAIRLIGSLSLAQRLRAQFGFGLFPGAGGAPPSVQLLPQFALQFPLRPRREIRASLRPGTGR